MDAITAEDPSTSARHDRRDGSLSDRDVIERSVAPSARYPRELMGIIEEFTYHSFSASILLITPSLILSTPDKIVLRNLNHTTGRTP